MTGENQLFFPKKAEKYPGNFLTLLPFGMNNDIFESRRLTEGCPVLIFDIPQQIQKEFDGFIAESRKIKNHRLAELKAHENVGYLYDGVGKKHNSYQCSISPHLVEQSFWMAWVLRLTAKYWGVGRSHRNFKIREYPGHFMGYDVWTNFAYKGDDNPTHNHAGFLSGVIYYKNHGHPTHFDEYNISYEGKDGTMVLFPSQVFHHVETQISNKERITLAFNIIETNNDGL